MTFYEMIGMEFLSGFATVKLGVLSRSGVGSGIESDDRDDLMTAIQDVHE